MNKIITPTATSATEIFDMPLNLIPNGRLQSWKVRIARRGRVG
jgi:hypothetical protein